MSKVLIAGMGNVLRRDDGFGVEVARRLATSSDPAAESMSALATANIKVVEVGIGGIHLVQELMDGYDMLVLVDAVEQGSAPGTVHVLTAEVDDLSTWGDDERSDFLADMHYTTPSRALVLAKALGVLPPRVYIVGCQPSEAEALGIGLSEPVSQALDRTIREIEKIVADG